jgi:hypothetical protein
MMRWLRVEATLTTTVFSASVMMCGAFAILLPIESGDWFTYGNVARNIYEGCGVAMSFSGRCEPHFGGAHLPLFPALVAVLWHVFGEGEGIVRAFNVVAAACANVVLARAVLGAGGSRTAAYAVGLLAALSPLTARWFGMLQTEPLALATTTLVAAELLLVVALRRVRTVLLAGLVVLAVWVRLDGVLLLLPVAAAFWLVRGWRGAAAPFLVVLMAVGITSGAWALRNLHVGIRPLPTGWMLPDGTLGPFGYLSWLKTWVVTEDARARASYFAINQYRRIDIDPSAFRRFDDRAEVEALLEQLRAAEGRTFPAEIDAAFAQLAAARRAQFGVADHARLLVQRVWDMAGPWVFPFLRSDGTLALRISAGSVMRAGHFWLFALGAALAWRQRWRLGLEVSTLAGVLFASRAVFFGAGMGLEARYMIEAVPFLSLAAAICLAEYWRRAMALKLESRRVSLRQDPSVTTAQP